MYRTQAVLTSRPNSGAVLFIYTNVSENHYIRHPTSPPPPNLHHHPPKRASLRLSFLDKDDVA